MKKLNKYPSFKIALIYAVASAIYIYTSDYFLEIFTSDVILLTKLQTLKGLFFIIITALLLYSLVKRNIVKMTDYYQEIIDVKQQLIKQSIRAKEEYSFLFDHSPLPMFLFDIETLVFLNVNEAACTMYGYSKEEFLQMSLHDIRPFEDIPIMEEILTASLKDDISPLSKLIRHKKKNGEIIFVKVKTSYVKLENKKVRLASVIDLTSEVTIQNELLETNSKLQAASDIAGLGYWTYDLLKSEIQWSDETYKIFEVTPENFKLTLENIKALFHPEDRSADGPEFYEKLNGSNET
ncbi:MAG: PAS domain-containing protein [Bacteroidetes bacterium]|nr:PAS domain-containing protein [Bacteroidota bacterium]